MAKSKSPIVVAAFADTHIGSSVGLCPPRVNLDDGGYYAFSDDQRWMWRKWQEFCRKAVDQAETWKAPLITIINGDLIETDYKKRSEQIYTRNKATLARVTYDVLRPVVDYSEEVYIIRGTEAHTGPSGQYEEMIAQDLINIVPADKKHEEFSFWYAELDIHGLFFLIAHHGKLGRLPWTKLNGAVSLAGQLMIQYGDRGLKWPDFGLFAHLHQYADTYTAYNTIRLIAMPCWQLPTAYVHRAVAGLKSSQIGGLILTCWPDGRCDVEAVWDYPPHPRPRKVLS